MASPEMSALDLTALAHALEASGHPWHAGETSMTRLTESERRTRLGVPLPADADHAALVEANRVRALQAEAYAAAVGAPASFDARNVGGSNYVTAVKDQGNCGSCVAFGTVGTAETTAAFTRSQPDLELDLSEAHLFYVHGAAAGASCSTGWWPAAALDAFRDIGVTFEDYFPYTAGNSGGATLNSDWPNRLAKVTGWEEHTSDPAAIKSWISSHGAIDACFYVYQDFFSYRTGVYKHITGDLAGGHCVTLIGYDDTQGCWIAKNSWNTGWGDQGFVKIGYGECNIEAWGVFGIQGVSLRCWVNGVHTLGLWTNDQPDNAWAYLETMGWLKLADVSEQANLTMLEQMSSAKLRGTTVNAFTDGSNRVTQVYVF
jgi:C1A family cysteine protease